MSSVVNRNPVAWSVWRTQAIVVLWCKSGTLSIVNEAYYYEVIYADIWWRYSWRRLQSYLLKNLPNLHFNFLVGGESPDLCRCVLWRMRWRMGEKFNTHQDQITVQVHSLWERPHSYQCTAELTFFHLINHAFHFLNDLYIPPTTLLADLLMIKLIIEGTGSMAIAGYLKFPVLSYACLFSL